MSETNLTLGSRCILPQEGFDQLLALLREQGYETLGPRVREAALTYGPIEGLADLPQGYTSEQNAGHYRLVDAGHKRYFDITPGAQSWKQFLFPPRSELFKLHKENGQWLGVSAQPPPRYAFIGVRGCEMAAIAVQDKVFIRPDFSDPSYAQRRANLFILAVDCLHPGGTCFCASMGTGPEVQEGFDLKLTELEDTFLVQVGTEAGLALIQRLETTQASEEQLHAAQAGLEQARQSMGRSLPDPVSIPELLLNNLEHPHWDDVAARCLSCTSCTQVCPTCFCWDVEDETSLDGRTTTRVRLWDSCFNPAFSGQAGGNIRPTTHSRYRQWLTHKLGSWQQQFGVLGCVGCGRCITWCPTGIDLTEEIAAMRAAEPA